MVGSPGHKPPSVCPDAENRKRRNALDRAMSSAASSKVVLADGSITQEWADGLTTQAQAKEYRSFCGGRGDQHASPRQRPE